MPELAEFQAHLIHLLGLIEALKILQGARG